MINLHAFVLTFIFMINANTRGFAGNDLAFNFFASSDVCCKCKVIYDLEHGRIILKPIIYYWGKDFVEKSELNYPATELWKSAYKNGDEHIFIKHIGSGSQVSRRISNEMFKIELGKFREKGKSKFVHTKLLANIALIKKSKEVQKKGLSK